MPDGARIGLVGCGRWGKHILRDLRALGCEVTAVARSPESRARAEAGSATVVGSIAELPEVDGVVVATPISTHAAVVEKALGVGVPVFVEKPLTNDLQAAERLAAEAGGRLFVMDKWRYHPGIELLAGLARGGELGPVSCLRTTRLGWERPRDVDLVWVLAPHDLAIGLEILGEIQEPRSAVASPDALIGLLGERPWQALDVSGCSHVRRREVALVCEEGIALLGDSFDDHAAIFRAGDREPERRPISSELPVLRELRAFVEHLAGGPPPRSSADDGVKVVRAISELRALAGLEP
ncbi:MAG: Gfo/Idh/MocA family protein [Gaiellaceae bacterium]